MSFVRNFVLVFALVAAVSIVRDGASAQTGPIRSLFGLAAGAVIDANTVVRDLDRDILGHAVWGPWQAYFWDTRNQRTDPLVFGLINELSPTLLGHYPGVGVITHDFQWKRVIGPLGSRTNPTPRQSTFDTPRGREFGPDEYGRFVEEFRVRTGRNVTGSIQVNIVSASADDAADWVEYMNAPNDGSNRGGGTDWAAVRAANGHPQPYGIKYWELGNEPHFTASDIGSLTAWDVHARIRSFVPKMKERDGSIQVMAYVNPFQLGDPAQIGSATSDARVGAAPDGSEPEDLTWSQAVLRHAGSQLDMVYFHWYSGWNQNVHSLEQVATTPVTGLVPWLDRLKSDIETYAPPDARERLRRVAIPEWNTYGGWFNPLSGGSAMLGAIAASRVLHVISARPEVVMAQRLALAAPYPDPPVNAPPSIAEAIDIRPGYFAIRARNNGAEYLTTSLYEMGLLWSRAFLERSVSVAAAGVPGNPAGVPLVDITALRSAGGGSSTSSSRIPTQRTSPCPSR